MKIFQRHSVQLLVSAMFLSVSVAAYAGNRVMVDNSVKELNDLNAKALSQVAVPKDGHISVKGDVRYVNGVADVRVTEQEVRQGSGAIRLPHISQSQPAIKGKTAHIAGTQKKKTATRYEKKGEELQDIGPVFHIQAPGLIEVKNESIGLGSRYVLTNHDKSRWQIATPIREEELHAPIISP